MKKKWFWLTELFPCLTKLWKIMRLCVFFLFLMAAQVWASDSYSQSTRLTLNMKDTRVLDILGEIEEKSEFYFLFNQKLVDVERKVDVEADQKKIEDILQDLFAGTNVNYLVVNRQIVLTTAVPSFQEDVNTPTQQQGQVTGKVTDKAGAPMPGVTVVLKGTTTGTVTDNDGNYVLGNVPANATLVFSFVGMRSIEVAVDGQNTISVSLEQDIIGMQEVIVVGYGTQKKSDITGTVASMPKERLELVPNLNVAQAIQGAVPGVMVQTSRTGAQSAQTIMVRGRNSIKANNDPLIIVDGIPYGGPLNDINPNNVESIEILKDASAAAIYGSRGSNGVILITTKEGALGKTRFDYDGKYGVTDVTKVHELLTGPEFYDFKMTRNPTAMTLSEKAIYDAGTWVDWPKLAIRMGQTQEHNLSVSGGFNNTRYYFGLGYTDIKGVAKNDDFQRLSSRINVETKIFDWLAIGTRSHLTLDDASGSAANFDFVRTNPLSKAYDENGKLTIHPWPENIVLGNLLGPMLYDDLDKSYQILSNNYALVDFPFIKGLTYRLNTGIRMRFTDRAEYRGRDTQSGYEALGRSSVSNSVSNSTVIENILSYNRDYGKHTVFATALYSYEGNNGKTNSLSARQFPNDFFSWYASDQAAIVQPSTSFNETNLISQMLRLNYSYASKYLATFTVRHDGYSGFGSQTKWGVFPSLALGWNIANEDFFRIKDIINVLKLRGSYGLNGNQAIGAYESISRLTVANIVSGNETQIGYKPSKLGLDNLGWESSRTLNLGFDFGILDGRISGDVNWYHTNTFDLLLDRSISPVHGIKSITQNIGETQNNGLEITFNSRNIIDKNFQWFTTGNLSLNKNKILSLYGFLDEDGNEIDDVGNAWFIGKPIRVNYDFIWDGTWQQNEAAEAAKYGSQPGYVKLRDFDGDGLTANDRRVIGQQDPKLLWGMTNTFSYRNFSLSVFIHGVHGATVMNYLMNDHVQGAEVRYNTLRKNWWTTDNPTNDWIINKELADRMSGFEGHIYEDAGYVRVKDISLSYDLAKGVLGRTGIDKIKVYVTGRNLLTFTKFTGLDPEFTDEDSQKYIPMQKEYVFGLSLGF